MERHLGAPLPDQFANNPNLEEQVIHNQIIYDGAVTSTGIGGTFDIPEDYCPVWVSIDVKGVNVKLTLGQLDHRCSAQPVTGAGSFKWEQPPIEYDPRALTSVFCGWDEPAYVYTPGVIAGTVPDWKLVADDFRCIGSMPITSVHWWGSYAEWSEPNNLPPLVPSAWLLGFWSNIPATGTAFSHPGRLLQVVRIPATQATITPAGIDRFTGKPSDTCYEYSVALNTDQYFWQDKYLANTTDNVFWLSITAVYTGNQTTKYPWGWKTRPAHWMDDAVTFPVLASDIPVGYQPSSTTMTADP